MSRVDAADVGRWLAGWCPTSGRRSGRRWADVLAAASLAAQEKLLRGSGGRLLRDEVVGPTRPAGPWICGKRGPDGRDVVVVAAGPGAVTTAADARRHRAGSHRRLEQVVGFGSDDARHGTTRRPCLSRGRSGTSRGFYSMPTPGRG